MFVEHLESAYVGDKGEVAGGVCFAGIVAVVDVEIIFVPFDDVVVGHCRTPGGDIGHDALRFWLSAEPAVVYSLGYH